MQSLKHLFFISLLLGVGLGLLGESSAAVGEQVFINQHFMGNNNQLHLGQLFQRQLNPQTQVRQVILRGRAGRNQSAWVSLQTYGQPGGAGQTIGRGNGQAVFQLNYPQPLNSLVLNLQGSLFVESVEVIAGQRQVSQWINLDVQGVQEYYLSQLVQLPYRVSVESIELRIQGSGNGIARGQVDVMCDSYQSVPCGQAIIRGPGPVFMQLTQYAQADQVLLRTKGRFFVEAITVNLR